MESAASAKSTRSVRGPPRACAGARRSGGSTAVPTLPTTTERSEVGALGAGVARRLVWHYPLAQQGVVAASHPPCAPSLQSGSLARVRFRHASLSARRCGGSLWCLDAWFERSPLRRRAFGARFCLTAPSTVASAVVPMAPTSTRTMAYEDNGLRGQRSHRAPQRVQPGGSNPRAYAVACPIGEGRRGNPFHREGAVRVDAADSIPFRSNPVGQRHCRDALRTSSPFTGRA